VRRSFFLVALLAATIAGAVNTWSGNTFDTRNQACIN